MLYFDFSGTLARWHDLAAGAVMTVALTAASMVLGMLVGVLCSAASRARYRPLRWAIASYVEVIRNTPFIVQLYIVYFGLPAAGIRLAPVTASILSMTIYVGAYLTETLRAGLESVSATQIEAGQALGLSRLRIFRHIVLPQAMASVYAALISQFVLLMLASSVVSSVSTPELTGAANDIQGQTFRAFEAFLVVAAIYLGLTAALRAALGQLNRHLFSFQFAGR